MIANSEPMMMIMNDFQLECRRVNCRNHCKVEFM